MYKQPAFRREHVADLLGRRLGEVPDYPNLFLPVAEHFCAAEQITLPHELLLAGRAELQKVVDAVAKLKANARELAA